MYMWVSTGSTHHKYYGPPFKNLLSRGAYLAPSLSEHSTDTFGYFAVLWSSEQEILSKDTHKVCLCCLGLEHAWQAIGVHGSSQNCTLFTPHHRQTACQASLSGCDPYIPMRDHTVGHTEEMEVALQGALKASLS